MPYASNDPNGRTAASFYIIPYNTGSSSWPARPSTSLVPAGYAFYISAVGTSALPTDSQTGDIVEIPAVSLPVFTAASPPAGVQGTAYTYTFAASNQPTAFAVASGTQPAGLTLDPSTGILSGTPSAAATYTFTVSASNSGGITTTGTLTIITTTTGTGSAAYAAAVISDSPVSYWRCQETSGTTATDSGSLANNGTYTGSPTFSASGSPVVGAKLVTLGVGSGITVPNNVNYQFGTLGSEAWTIEMVVRLDGSPSTATFPGIIYKGVNDSTNGWQTYWSWDSGTSKWVVNWSRNGEFYGQAETTLNSVHHVVLTWNGTHFISYLDGTAVGSPVTSTTTTAGNTTAGITVQPGITIGEIALYRTALSSTRVTAHYAAV